MNEKHNFLHAVAVAVTIWMVLSLLSGVLVLFDLTDVGFWISLVNLMVDIVVGIFTVWGLFWAASEFAAAQVKPDLRLIIGRESEDRLGIVPLKNEADELIGRDGLVGDTPASQVIIGLFLENGQPKAAQYVRITLRVRNTPPPGILHAVGRSFNYEPKINEVRGEALFLQFGEELVVYQGDGVHLGNIRVAWAKDVRPDKVDLVAGLYSLDSRPKEIIVSHPIHWAVSTANQE